MEKPIVVIKVVKPYEISEEKKDYIANYIKERLSSEYHPIVTFDAEIDIKIYR